MGMRHLFLLPSVQFIVDHFLLKELVVPNVQQQVEYEGEVDGDQPED